MSRNFYIVVGLIIILVIIGVVMSSRRNTTPTNSSGEALSQSEATGEALDTITEDGVVTYSDAGFLPSSLTVKVGTTVTFKNEASSMPMWVASNPHPVHTGLSGFDAKKDFKSGESYTFTFTKAGTWGYHNHSSPGETGTIVVE